MHTYVFNLIKTQHISEAHSDGYYLYSCERQSCINKQCATLSRWYVVDI